MQTSMSQAIQEAVKALAEIRQKRLPPVPPSWFTIKQFMDYQKCSKDKANTDLGELVRAGKFESRQWPKLDCRGRTCYQTIYKKK